MKRNIKEIIDNIFSLKNEVYDYVTNIEHWLFYWIDNKEVQNFIKEYPEDFEDRVHLSVSSLNVCPTFKISFDDHPDNILEIERFAVLNKFREIAETKWIMWNGRVNELQIEEKKRELLYYKEKLAEIEKELEIKIGTTVEKLKKQ